MKNTLLYASRPSSLYGSKEDVKFISSLNKQKEGNAEILAEGHDFKYIQSINLRHKIEKIVSKVDKVYVLHDYGIIDQKQYFEVMIALIHNIPVLALNINGRITKRVVGIEKYFDAGIRKRATLKLADVLPN
jgi:hypothetical protein